MAVFISDLAVAVLNDEFRLLIPGDLSCGVDSFALRRRDDGDLGIALAADRPVFTVRHNPLILSFAHDFDLLFL